MYPEFFDSMEKVQPLEVHQRINFPALMEQQHHQELRSYMMAIFVCGLIFLLFVVIQ
jgi:hypothetical protein